MKGQILYELTYTSYNSNQLHKKESGMVAAKARKGGNGELPRNLFFKMKQIRYTTVLKQY